MQLIDIKSTEHFKDTVMSQRDALLLQAREHTSIGSAASISNAEVEELLKEIRDLLIGKVVKT